MNYIKKMAGIPIASILLAMIFTMNVSASFSVTDSRFVVLKENDYQVSFDKNNELRLDRKFFDKLLEKGPDDIAYITIIETPKSDLATLFYGKVEVIPLDSYKLGMLTNLKLVGNGNDVYITFIAKSKEGKASEVSRINVTNAAKKTISSEDIRINTGVNMKVQGQLRTSGSVEGNLIYEVLTAPTKGDLHYSSAGSSFVYTPHSDKSGSDSLTYTVRNSLGERSPVSKVSIKINKLKDDVFYNDMADSANHYGAIKLAELGVFRGERVAGMDFIYPSMKVSRGEFLVMLMNASKLDANSQVIANRRVEDDKEIPVWMKNYFSSAYASGIVSGDNGELNASADITRAEAAVMLCNVFPKLLENVSTETFSVIDEVPQWAEIAVNALEKNKIMIGDGEGNLNANGILTREAAVSLIWKMMNME